MADILFIQTGGTIDKDYPQGATHHGYEFAIGEPAIHSILRRAKPSFSYEVLSAMRKDSLDITDTDREELRALVESRAEQQIVITHGTDTMKQTAEILRTVKNKTIVLTGAMLPEKFRDSDADFNVGMAIGAVQRLEPGVYISLGGLIENVTEI